MARKSKIFDKKGSIKKPSKVVEKKIVPGKLNLPLFEASELKMRSTDVHYSKYINAIVEHKVVNWLNTELAKNKGEPVIVRTRDFASKVLGMQLTQKDYDGGKASTSVFWGTKFALFVTGHFNVEQRSSKLGESMLAIAHARSFDALPPSLDSKMSDKQREDIKPFIEVKAKAEAEAKAEEDARDKAEEEARVKAEEEAEAKSKAEEEAEAKAEAEREAKAKAEEEARAKAEEEARAKAEEEAEQNQ